MQNRDRDQVKVAVYCADIPAEQQRFQEMLTAGLLCLSAVVTVWLGYLL
jgi:hypothetical protein